MRYREPGEGKSKILWILLNEPGKMIEGTHLSEVSSVTWSDEGTPWAVYTLEEVKYNVNVSDYIRARGP